MEPALPDTLIVRRLPETLTERDLNDLFRFFGAQSVKKENPKGRQRNGTTIIKFSSHEDASYALTRLHQLQVLGKRIVVEYADFTVLPDIPQNVPAPNPMIEKQCFKYPPANEQIVNTIAAVLLTNPDLYHNVLQLMRSMNLPPPFYQVTKQPVIVVEPSDIEEVEMEELYKEDTEESELEIDPTVLGNKDVIPEVPVKRKKQIKRPNKLKAIKPTSVPPDKGKPPSLVQNVSEVFEQKELSSIKKLAFKISSEIPQITNQPEEVNQEEKSEGFGVFAPPATTAESEQDEDSKNQTDDANQFISKRKLQTNKLQDEEMKLLPVFKNYSTGTPSSRLYVKNLAKTIKEADLKHIYGRYVLWTSEEERNMFDIRLMTEGRMKGQAFITLPNVDRAKEALSDTNGIMLQGKPLVVQFARSAQINTTSITV